MTGKTKEVYSKETVLDGDLTWESLRRLIDELLQENGLPTDIKIDYLDWSQGSSYRQVHVVVADGELTVS